MYSFINDKRKHVFKLYLNKSLVAKTYYNISNGDDLFNKEYVGLFRLETKEKYRNKGYMTMLLEYAFNYIKNDLKINYIVLNVNKNNNIALNFYKKHDFILYKNHSVPFDDNEYYYTLIKKLLNNKNF